MAETRREVETRFPPVGKFSNRNIISSLSPPFLTVNLKIYQFGISLEEKNLSLSIGIKVSKFERRVYIRVCIYVCSWRQRPNTSKIINARPGQIKYSRSDKIKREKPRDKIKTSAATVS